MYCLYKIVIRVLHLDKGSHSKPIILPTSISCCIISRIVIQVDIDLEVRYYSDLIVASRGTV